MRNAGSVAGNVMMTKHWGFASDICVFLMALQTKVHIRAPLEETVSFLEFINRPVKFGEVIVSFEIPDVNGDYYADSYKIAKR